MVYLENMHIERFFFRKQMDYISQYAFSIFLSEAKVTSVRPKHKGYPRHYTHL